MADKDMRKYDLFEIKAATFLIGLCGIVAGVSTYGPADSLFVRALQATPIAHSWGVLLVAVGGWTLASAFQPRRANRHHALTASWIMLWATFGIFLHWGRITFPAALVWVHGTAALVTLLVDVHAHDRAMQRVRERSGERALG